MTKDGNDCKMLLAITENLKNSNVKVKNTMRKDNWGKEVFISYASKDKKIAEEVCSYLEQNDITCWIAPRNILPGTEYGEAIMNGIESCRIMVLIFSESSNASQHVLREVERAVSKNLPIIAYKISNTNPCKSMEYFLFANQWLDAIGKGNHIGELHSSIKAIIGKEEGKVVDAKTLGEEKKTKSYRKAIPLVTAISCLVALLIITFAYFNNRKQEKLEDGDLLASTDYFKEKKEPEETNMDADEQGQQNSEIKEGKTSIEENEKVQSSLTTEERQANPVAIDEEQSNNEDKEPVQPNDELEESVAVQDMVAIGDLIMFGTYEPQGYSTKNEDSDLTWIIIDIDKNNNQLVLLSEKILDMKPFDAAESGAFDKDNAGNSYDRNIKENYTFNQMIEFRGNSNWEASNIRTWLNSDAARVTYLDQEPSKRATDEAVNSYELQVGFLYGFTKEEKAMLRERESKTTLNAFQAEKDGKEAFVINSDSIAESYDFSSCGMKTTMDKVFLLSLDEVKKYLFDNNLLIFVEPTQSAMDSDKSSYYKSYLAYDTKYCPWLLRTPNGTSAHEILAIGAGISDSADIWCFNAASCGLGIRPAITISMDQVTLDGDGSKENPFIVVN